MDRRTALKNLSLSIGYAVAAPTIMNMLYSCKSETETWIPKFFSKEEKHITTHLIDVILPSSDTPGGLDVNIPQFIDLMYQDIETEQNQTIFKKGAALFAESFNKKYDKSILNGTNEDFESILSNYLNIPDEKTRDVLKQQNIPKNQASGNGNSEYYIYKFLLSVRYYAIFGYCTSEKIGEEVLAYDPIPGSYDGCADLNEISNGRAWSL